ncbi:MAG: multidrug transporter [Pseudomonadota bacterium]
MKKTFAISIFILTFGLFSAPSFSEDLIEKDYESDSVMMMVDLLVARPLLAGATLAGTIVYGLSYPFSRAGGNNEQALHTLVHVPAYNTFKRCLGCKSSAELDHIEKTHNIKPGL